MNAAPASGACQESRPYGIALQPRMSQCWWWRGLQLTGGDLFFFGLLRDEEILGTVIGRSSAHLRLTPGFLSDFHLLRMRGENFPLLSRREGSQVTGIFVEGLTDADLDRVLFFESVEYDLHPLPINLVDGTSRIAHVFHGNTRASHDAETWSFEAWKETTKRQDLKETHLWMSLYGLLPLAEADSFWDRVLENGQDLEEAISDLRQRLGVAC